MNENLEKALMAIAAHVDSHGHNLTVKPRHLIMPQWFFKVARRILFPHHILKRRKGARGRAMTLKWRRK
jgi:phage major head subunit gpT-like protein